MDRGQFDSLARLVSTQRSRRAALVTLLGVALMRHDSAAVLVRGKGKFKAQKPSAEAKATTCYPGGKQCIPGKGKNVSSCDFSHSTLLQNRDVRGANLSNSNFFGADLTGADLRGANLSGGCFVGADLTGARLGGSVNLHQAIFCQTIMPDGRIDDSGCEGDTPCCHRRLQDCPDANIMCFVPATPPGICGDCVGMFGPVGRCYQFPAFCCPCAHNDLDYWVNLCNQTFPERCNGQCLAQDDANFTCWDTCSGGPPQSGGCSAPIPPPDR